MSMRARTILLVAVWGVGLCSAADLILIEDMEPDWAKYQAGKVILAGTASSLHYHLHVLDPNGRAEQVVDMQQSLPYWCDAVLSGDTLYGVNGWEELRFEAWKAGARTLEVVLLGDTSAHTARLVDLGAEFVVAWQVQEDDKKEKPAHLRLMRVRKADGACLWSEKIPGDAKILYAESETPGAATLVTYDVLDPSEDDRKLACQSIRIAVQADGSTQTQIKAFEAPFKDLEIPYPPTLVKAGSYYYCAPTSDEAIHIGIIDFEKGTLAVTKLPETIEPPFSGAAAFATDGERLFLCAAMDGRYALVTTTMTGEITNTRPLSPELMEGLLQLGWTARNPQDNSMVKADRPFILAGAVGDMSFHVQGNSLCVVTRVRKIDQATEKESYATALLKIAD